MNEPKAIPCMHCAYANETTIHGKTKYYCRESMSLASNTKKVYDTLDQMYAECSDDYLSREYIRSATEVLNYIVKTAKKRI